MQPDSERPGESEAISLLDRMTVGIALGKAIYDEGGEPIDILYTFLNRAFAAQIGVDPNRFLNRRLTEAIPDIREDPVDWISFYGNVAKTGEPARFEAFFRNDEKWYSVEAFSPKKDHFAAELRDITELKRSEEALRHSEKFYRTLFENTDDGFQLVEPISDEGGNIVDFRFLEVNEAYEGQTGLKASEVVGRTMKEVNPSIAQHWIDANSMVSRTGRAAHCENYHEGTHRWYEIHLFPFDKGMVGGLLRDVTDKKRAEEELRESEELYRTLFENTQEAFQLIEPIYDGDRVVDWMFLDVNEAFERLVGQEAVKIIGKRIREFQPDLERCFLDIIDRVSGTGKAEQREGYDQRTDRWYDGYFFKLREGQVGILFHDLTEKKRFEEAAAEANDRAVEIVESITDGFELFDRDWRYAYANKRAGELLGLPAEEAVGKVLWEMFPNLVGTKFEAELVRAMEAKIPAHFIEYFPEPVNLWLEVNSYPSDDGLTAYFRDVTRKVRGDELNGLLSRIHDQILSNPRFDEMMGIVMEQVNDAFDADRTVLNLLDGEELVVLYSHGSSPVQVGLRYNEAQGRTAFEAVRGKKTIIVPDANVDRRVNLDFCRCTNSMAFITIPLVLKGEGIGALNISFIKPRKFISQEIEFAEKLAATLALAIENAQLFETIIRNEVKYRGIFESVQENLYVGRVIEDETGRIVDWMVDEANPAGLSTLGDTEQAPVMGRPMSEVLGQENNKLYTYMLEKARLSGSVVSFEHRSYILGMDYIASVIVTANTFIATQRDITGIKEAQHRAEDERSRLQAVLDTAPVGIIFAEVPSGRILFANEEMWNLYGQEPNDILSVGSYPAGKAFREDGRPYALEEYPMARAAKGEVVWGQVASIIRGDGTHAFTTTNAAPVKDAEGKIVAVVATSMDISNQVNMQNELLHSNEELRQFAYVASHDLQEPIRSVLNNLALLNKKYGEEMSDGAKVYASTAMEGAERMRELVDDLLQYARIDSVNKPFGRVDLNEVAASIRESLRAAIEESGASVTIEQLPSVQGDPRQLAQVLQNLLSNAIKFRGKGTPEVVISSSHTAREHVISVRDNGIGIDPRYTDDLFQMFVRLYSKHEYPGTGIGLALSKKIIERHGGSIWVESELGEGSTFYFTIPRTRRPFDG